MPHPPIWSWPRKTGGWPAKPPNASCRQWRTAQQGKDVTKRSATSGWREPGSPLVNQIRAATTASERWPRPKAPHPGWSASASREWYADTELYRDRSRGAGRRGSYLAAAGAQGGGDGVGEPAAGGFVCTQRETRPHEGTGWYDVRLHGTQPDLVRRMCLALAVCRIKVVPARRLRSSGTGGVLEHRLPQCGTCCRAKIR